jgi:hypothetical protein
MGMGAAGGDLQQMVGMGKPILLPSQPDFRPEECERTAGGRGKEKTCG